MVAGPSYSHRNKNSLSLSFEGNVYTYCACVGGYKRQLKPLGMWELIKGLHIACAKTSVQKCA